MSRYYISIEIKLSSILRNHLPKKGGKGPGTPWNFHFYPQLTKVRVFKKNNIEQVFHFQKYLRVSSHDSSMVSDGDDGVTTEVEVLELTSGVLLLVLVP